jgi:hypothetical protein
MEIWNRKLDPTSPSRYKINNYEKSATLINRGRRLFENDQSEKKKKEKHETHDSIFERILDESEIPGSEDSHSSGIPTKSITYSLNNANFNSDASNTKDTTSICSFHSQNCNSNTNGTTICQIGPTGSSNQSKTVLFWNSGIEGITGTGFYIGWGYIVDANSIPNASETTSIIIPYNGILTDIYVRVNNNVSISGNIEFDIYKNGILLTPSVIIGPGDSSANVTFITNNIVKAGDLIAVEIANSDQGSDHNSFSASITLIAT